MRGENTGFAKIRQSCKFVLGYSGLNTKPTTSLHHGTHKVTLYHVWSLWETELGFMQMSTDSVFHWEAKLKAEYVKLRF